jgi:hypothetical protein
MAETWDNITQVPELMRYKNLDMRVKELMNDTLENCREPTHKMIKDRIKGELAFINISHPKFDTSLKYTVEELNNVYPIGHPDR